MKKLVFFIFLLSLFTLLACKEEERVVKPPVVSLIDPLGSSMYYVFDTIFIKAIISHESSLNTITLSVTNELLKPVVSSKTLNVNNSNITLDSYLVINNKYIEDEVHYLLIEMSDNENLFKEWYPIKIQPLSKQLENVLYVTEEGLQHNLYLISDVNDSSMITAWNSEYLGGYVDSYHRQFYTSGTITEGIKAYDIDDKKLNWTIPPKISGTQPYFTAFSAIDGRVSAANREGVIECFNSEGMKTCITSKRNNGKYTYVINSRNFVMGLYTPFSGNIHSFDIYNYPAGSLYQSLELPGIPFAIVKIDENNFLLFLEKELTISSYKYSPFEKSLTPLDDITNDKPILKIVGEGNNIFVLTPNGVLFYRPDLSSTVNIFYQSGIENIVYDPIDSIIYMIKAHEIMYSVFPFNYAIKGFDAGLNVKDVLLLYNK